MKGLRPEHCIDCSNRTNLAFLEEYEAVLNSYYPLHPLLFPLDCYKIPPLSKNVIFRFTIQAAYGNNFLLTSFPLTIISKTFLF